VPIYALNDAPSWTDVAVVVLTAIFILVTVWQMIYVRAQTNYVRTQTNLLLRTIRLAENDQRAWVGVKTIRVLSSRLDDPNEFRVAVVWENSGRTPALKVRGQARLGIEPGIDIVTSRSIGNIFPNASLSSFASLLIEPQSVDDIESGKAEPPGSAAGGQGLCPFSRNSPQMLGSCCRTVCPRPYGRRLAYLRQQCTRFARSCQVRQEATRSASPSLSPAGPS
jgi:hypothetical protein